MDPEAQGDLGALHRIGQEKRHLESEWRLHQFATVHVRIVSIQQARYEGGEVWAFDGIEIDLV